MRRRSDEVGTDVGNLKKLLSTLLDNTQRGHLQDSRVSIQEAVQFVEKIESAAAPEKAEEEGDAMVDVKPEVKEVSTIPPSPLALQPAPAAPGGSTSSG